MKIQTLKQIILKKFILKTFHEPGKDEDHRTCLTLGR